LIYIAFGAALHMGLPIDSILDEVHQANMQKVPGMTKRGVQNDAVKPHDWEGPEARISLLIKQAWSNAICGND
jgi:predicted HAD superfamily Cof-like phosphohydrolase